MRKIFLAVALLCGIFLPAEAAEVRTRPSGTLCSSADWEVSGSVLTATSSGSRAAYVPLRRHSVGAKWDAGSIRKILLDTNAGTVDWQSETSLPRDVLRPVFENGSAVAGAAVSMADFDADAAEACGLDEDSWSLAVEMMNSRAMGAPYPASMALANGVLYVLCDDGVLCAINASSGTERWNFLLPSACERLKDALEAGRSTLPWMCAGGLTAEDLNGKVHLWGTLGEAGRGLFCVDVSGSVPSLLWSVEDSSASSLGLTGASPLVVSLNGKLTVITPSGPDVSGTMLLFDAESGALSSTVRGLDGKELILSPVGLTESDSLSAVVCCDASGGAQYFTREGSSLSANFRVDFENVSGLGGLEFSFSPIACSTSRGAWLAFVAEASEGVLVAASPASNKSVSWTATPWRGSGYGWWMLCEGFSRPFSALVYDGLLYLLGWEDGHMELKVIDLTPGRLVASSEVSGSSIALTVSDGQVVLLGDDGTVIPVSELSEDIANIKTGILYTLVR